MSEARSSAAVMLAEASDTFRQYFGAPHRLAAQAPGRVNFIGDHTDYTDGVAMPFAIDRHLLVLAREREPGNTEIRLRSSADDHEHRIDLTPDPLPGSTHWDRYLRGLLQGLREHAIRPPALDLLVHSNLPVGAGLSSSAALELAALHVLLAAAGRTLDAEAMIRLAQRAEHDYADVPCGLLDQFCVQHATADSLLLFDSRSVSADVVRLPRDEIGFLVINSHIAHTLSDGGYAARREQCDRLQQALGQSLRDTTIEDLEAAVSDPLLLSRGRHVINENQRVRAMREALPAADWKRVGALLFESHASLRDDFEVSCSEIDLLVALASELTDQGLIGARMTGGGFGGSIIALVHLPQADGLMAAIGSRYREATGIRTDPVLVQPGPGAGLIEQESA